MPELSSQDSRTEPPDGDLPLDVRQRLHSQVPFALPVIALVPVVIGVVLATMPAHSATNLGAVRLMKQRSVILLEAIVVVVGTAAFALGLLVWHR